MADHSKVKDYMTTEVDTVSPDNTVRDAISLIRRTGHDGFPVVRDSKVIGYISAADMLEKSLDEKI